MKRTVLFALVAVWALLAVADDEENQVWAYIVDDTPTNVRCEPKGAVAFTLPCDWSYIVCLSDPTNGWWRLRYAEIAEEAEEVRLAGSSTEEYWVHYSVVGIGTRNYGNQRLVLRAQPFEAAAVVYSFTEELSLHPLEVNGDWVKVVTPDGQHTGWIDSEWLCSNPLTNCC